MLHNILGGIIEFMSQQMLLKSRVYTKEETTHGVNFTGGC